MNRLKRMSMAMAANQTSGSSTIGPSDTDSVVTESTMSKPRPSLAGVMMARKYSKRLSSRMVDRKVIGTVGSSSAVHIASKEPTYRMEPMKKFSTLEAERVIKEVVDEKLDGFKYNAKYGSVMIKSISEEIKERIKQLGYDRYKVICVISLCQRNEQSAVCCSRAMLDKDNDSYATYTLKDSQYVCNATVFGIYRE